MYDCGRAVSGFEQWRVRYARIVISLQNQAVVVAGASSGIGRAVAVAMAREGARVLASARREDRLAQLREEVSGIEIHRADVARRAGAEGLIAAALERFGRIDILVYAAGDNIPARAMNVLAPETWDHMLAVNLTGAFDCTRAALPAMRAAGGGLIVYISSISAHVPDVSGAAYQAAKRGLAGLAHATRMEEKANGIRTSVIFPGLVRTEMIHKRPVITPEEVLAKALLPEDVAEAVMAIARLDPRVAVPEMEVVPSRL
jgi:serine 3-dehydrogenase (NADP+)